MSDRIHGIDAVLRDSVIFLERRNLCMPPIINRSLCIRCGTCAQICPLDVIRVRRGEGRRIVDVLVKYPYECWHCLACVKDCPKEAITMRYPLSHMMLTMDVPGKEQG